MLIWSWQGSECADTLEVGMPWRCDAEKASWSGYFDYCYDWIASEMAIRIGEPPEGVRWPVWGWARYEFVDGACPKDDDEMVDPSAEGDYVRLLLDVPDELVLLSDEDAWGSILNGFPVEPPEWAHITDEELLGELLDGLIDMRKDFDSVVPPDEVLATWTRVFDTSKVRSDIGNWHGRYIQATFWEIRPEWVVRAQRFHNVPHKSAYDCDFDDDGDDATVTDGNGGGTDVLPGQPSRPEDHGEPAS